MLYLGSSQKLIERLAAIIAIQHFHIDEFRETKLFFSPAVHCVSQHSLKILEKYQGNTAVCFFCADTKKRFFAPENCRIDANSQVVSELTAIFGQNNVKFG